MCIKTNTPEIDTNNQATQQRLVRKRRFLVALLSAFSMYYQLGGMTSYFTATTGFNELLIHGGGFALVITGLMLAPPLAKRLGILDSLGKFRLFFTVASAIGILAYTGLTVIIACAQNPSEPLCAGLAYLALLAPAAVTSCSLHRAVKVISVKQSAVFSGLLITSWLAVFLLHMLFMGVFNYFIVLYVSEPIVYAAPLIIAIVLLYTDKNDFAYTAQRSAAYFSDALFTKFLIAAALLLLLDMFQDGSYYGGGTWSNIFSMWMQLATFILPLGSGCLIAFLLQRNKWFPVAMTIALLICFEQGLVLFFNDNNQLAVAYAISSSLISSGPLILSLFIPMVFCTQRRSSVTAITGMLSLWLLGTVINTFLTSIPGVPFTLSSLVSPPAVFVISLAATAYLFYLYSENNRVYIATLMAEFKTRDIDQINTAVSQADRFEHLGLAPREKEVCALLLKSLTVRQISGELGLAFSTVNGYYRSLYRKLGINSKAELFMRFGAEQEPEL